MTEKSKLYIVVCIDTEGPAGYALDSWDRVDDSMRILTSPGARMRFVDSRGNGLILNFFIMDWTGFDENPYGRQTGYGAVYEHYRKNYFDKMPSGSYSIAWHYHHPYKDGKWRSGGWNTDWNDNNEYENQINRVVYDRGYFPVVYRAGGLIETNDQSAWLEKWIPFDYSSVAPEPSLMHYAFNIKDIIKLRYEAPLWNWSRAVSDWGYYHPSKKDYRLKGDMNRTIFRCLDIKSSAYKLADRDIADAFKKARHEGRAIFSFFSHDYYASCPHDVMDVLARVRRVSADFKDVEYEYETAVGAARKVIFGESRPKEGSIRLNIKMDDTKKNLLIESSRDAWCKQPWIVIKGIDGVYSRIDAAYMAKNSWSAPIDYAATAGVAAAVTDETGEYAVSAIKDIQSSCRK